MTKALVATIGFLSGVVLCLLILVTDPQLPSSPSFSVQAAAVNQAAHNSVRIYGSDGMFHVRAMVGETMVDFLVDTGSYDVALRYETAQQLPRDVAIFASTRPAVTAVSRITVTNAEIRELSIGPIVLKNVRASVLPKGAESNLLGMTFLSRLSGKWVGDTLVLEQ